MTEVSLSIGIDGKQAVRFRAITGKDERRSGASAHRLLKALSIPGEGHVSGDELDKIPMCDRDKALAHLYAAYQDWLVTSNWTDAEEAAQDAFVLAYQRLGQLRDVQRFGGWLFPIVARRCIEAVRRRRPTPVEDVEVLSESLAEGPPEPESESMALRDTIQAAIGALPEHYRAVVVLRYGQDMSVKDISRTLDRPLGTVVSQIFRANRMLREQLQHVVTASTGQR